MASIYRDIRAALEETLNNISGLPDIAWENVNFKPDTGTSFVSAVFSPLNRRPAVRGLTPQQRYDGIFTLFVYCPENEGPGTCEEIADSIVETFEATTDISYEVDTNTTIIVSIDEAQREQGISQSPWYYIPVTIRWYIYN